MRSTSIVLVEQRVRRALEVADRGYLLEDGRISVSGDADELMADENVIEMYMGGV